MSRTLIIQLYHAPETPAWIERCMNSVAAWARLCGFDYRRASDEVFDLCGPEFLAQTGENVRAVANLARFELVRQAHREGYDFAVWVDADVLVFDPDRFRLDGVARYAFAREAWVALGGLTKGSAFEAVNNCVFACRAGEPDLDFLIEATRHIAAHRPIRDNFQVGGDLIKGLRNSLDFQALDHVGMFSNYVVIALARGVDSLCRLQGELHGTPVYAANLCGSANHTPAASEADVLRAIEVLEATRGAAINRGARGRGALERFEIRRFACDPSEAAVIYGTALKPPRRFGFFGLPRRRYAAAERA
jgi:hypothetical protein